MVFREKLKTLMDIYRVQNITLARGLGVDPSLVSRWKSGERVPMKYEAVMSDIAAYLSGLGMLQHDRETLHKLLDFECETRQQTQERLLDWLMGRMTQTPPPELRPEEPTLLRQTFAQIEHLFHAGGEVTAGPVSIWPHVQKGRPAEHEVFRDRPGKRQAAINFLHAVLSSGKPGDVYFISQEDPVWITEDTVFFGIWERCLRALVSQGSHVHMLHPTDDGARLPEVYRPLYSSGRFTSYASNVSAPGLPTFFVSRGNAAMVSYCTGGRKSADTTFLFRQEQDTETYENLLHAYLDDSEPVAFACPTPLSYAEQLLRLEEKTGAYYCVKSAPDAILLPEALLYDLLSASFCSQEVDVRLDLLARRREIFEQHLLAGRPWTLIFPMAILDAIALNDTCRVSGLELFGTQDAVLSGSSLRQFLTGLQTLTDRFDSLRIYFLEDCPQTSLVFKEGQGALFVHDTSTGSPSAVFLGDKRLVGALSRWLAAKTRSEEGLLQNSMIADIMEKEM